MESTSWIHVGETHPSFCATWSVWSSPLSWRRLGSYSRGSGSVLDNSRNDIDLSRIRQHWHTAWHIECSLRLPLFEEHRSWRPWHLRKQHGKKQQVTKWSIIGGGQMSRVDRNIRRFSKNRAFLLEVTKQLPMQIHFWIRRIIFT